MKLLTQIPPRRDGTVKLTENGKTWCFVANEDGVLACDVDDDALVARVLRLGGDFFPADEGDYEKALALTRAAEVFDEPQGGDDLDDLDDLDDEDEVIGAGLPVEANTAPVAPAAGPSKKKAAKA